jgi:hypothetical protein
MLRGRIRGESAESVASMDAIRRVGGNGAEASFWLGGRRLNARVRRANSVFPANSRFPTVRPNLRTPRAPKRLILFRPALLPR